MNPQWPAIHPRPPTGDRIIPEASHLQQPQEARGSCALSVQLPYLYRKAEKRGRSGKGHPLVSYRLSFSSNIMGGIPALEKNRLLICRGGSAGFRKLEKQKEQVQEENSPPPCFWLSESTKTEGDSDPSRNRR